MRGFLEGIMAGSVLLMFACIMAMITGCILDVWTVDSMMFIYYCVLALAAIGIVAKVASVAIYGDV